jgi:hypothetical protein
LLIAELQAPPDLSDGIQSLAYWRERLSRLAWYRFRARREAARMILRWEHRVRGALLYQPGVAINVRASAAMLIARSRLRRWSRRAALVVMAIVGLTIMATPFVAVVVALTHIF